MGWGTGRLGKGSEEVEEGLYSVGLEGTEDIQGAHAPWMHHLELVEGVLWDAVGGTLLYCRMWAPLGPTSGHQGWVEGHPVVEGAGQGRWVGVIGGNGGVRRWGCQ